MSYFNCLLYFRLLNTTTQMKNLFYLIAIFLFFTACNFNSKKNTIKNNFKDIDIEMEGDTEIFANDSIYSVFENLFRNSLEHGEATKITIQIIEHEKTVNVYIADNGKGIPAEIKSKIFDEGFTKGKMGNTGLGLYIAKKAVNSFAGKIFVKDNEPQGALFILILKKK